MLKKLMISVLTGRETRHRLELANKTWAPGLRNVFFFTDEHTSHPNVVFSGKMGDRRSLYARYAFALKRSISIASARRATHVMMLDDDTFVHANNLIHFFHRLNKSHEVFVGQKCPEFAGWASFCGGAGWIASVGVLKRLDAALPSCRRNLRMEIEYDRIFGGCLLKMMHVQPTWHDGFHSQPPLYYFSRDGRSERPNGLVTPITFHYMTIQRHHQLMSDAKNLDNPDAFWLAFHAVAKRPSPSVEGRGGE